MVTSTKKTPYSKKTSPYTEKTGVFSKKVSPYSDKEFPQVSFLLIESGGHLLSEDSFRIILD